MAKEIKTAVIDCLKFIGAPNNWAKMPLSKPLPRVVSKIIKGNLTATKDACKGALQRPMVTP